MSDPRPLADLESDGTPEERELVEAARARGMPAAAKLAVWSAVVAHGVGAASSAQAAVTAGASAKGGALAGLWSWKGIALLAAVGATAVTTPRLFHAKSPAPPRLPAHAAPAPSRPATLPNQIGRSDVPSTVEPPPGVESPARAPGQPTERSRPARPAPVATGSAPPASRLAEEAQSLVEARRLLRTGAVAAAISALQQADREFAGGRLRQEREALLIDALAQNGQLDLARRRAADFLRNYPASPHAADVRHHVDAK